MSYSSTTLSTANLLAYLRLGEAVGTSGAGSVIDASGNGYHGTPTGTTTFGATGALTGDADTALTLSGTGHVNLGDVAALELVSPYSIECWVNFSANGSFPPIITKADVRNTASAKYALWGNTGVRTLAFSTGGSTVLNSATVLAIGTWYHVVVTRSGTSFVLYLNGTSNTTGTSSAAPTYGTESVRIGSWDAASTQGFPGSIDEVAFYSRALDASEVLAHYNAGLGIGGTPSSSLLLRRRRCA